MRDERAVSFTVSYVLGLAIASLLIVGLLIAGGNFVQDQRETGARTEMEVIGEQIAADIQSADRMVQTTTANETVVVRRSLPSRVSGSGYTIAVTDSDDPQLVLTAYEPGVEISAEFANATAIEPTRISGGSIQVRWDSVNETLRLEGRDR